MAPRTQSNSPDRDSPKLLKTTFQPRLEGWGLTPAMLDVLGAVLGNWLAGEAAEDIEHFRHRQAPKRTSELNQLLSRTLVTSSTGKFYEPKFLAFCLLLVSGNRTATKLRFVMDDVFRLVKQYLKEPPPNRRTTTTFLKHLPEDDQPLLIPAIKLLSETSVGISLGSTNTPYPDVNFTDSIFEYSSVTKLAWSFLQDYRGTSWAFSGASVQAVSVPFDLTRLQIAAEVHASASKAVSSIASHPDSAVSHARAALEATLKHVLGAGHPALEKSLPKQAAAVRNELLLEKEFSELGTRLVSVMETIGDIRNSFGDSHGRAPGQRGATRPEALLSVGTSLLLCEFLLDRHEFVKSMPGRPQKPQPRSAHSEEAYRAS